jgi:hypothetical protein
MQTPNTNAVGFFFDINMEYKQSSNGAGRINVGMQIDSFRKDKY